MKLLIHFISQCQSSDKSLYVFITIVLVWGS